MRLSLSRFCHTLKRIRTTRLLYNDNNNNITRVKRPNFIAEISRPSVAQPEARYAMPSITRHVESSFCRKKLFSLQTQPIEYDVHRYHVSMFGRFFSILCLRVRL